MKINRNMLKEKYGDEEVLVVPVKYNFKFIKNGYRDIHLINMLEFKKRHEVEYNPSYKQLIPYVIIKKDNKLFGTTRLAKSGEARLVNKISLGIGGHINPCDYNGGHLFTTLKNALVREITEEVITPIYLTKILPLGLIYHDDNNGVSSDHIGVAYLYETSEDVEVREKDKLSGKFYTLEELNKSSDNLEDWSLIVLKKLMKRNLIK